MSADLTRYHETIKMLLKKKKHKQTKRSNNLLYKIKNPKEKIKAELFHFSAIKFHNPKNKL